MGTRGQRIGVKRATTFKIELLDIRFVGFLSLYIAQTRVSIFTSDVNLNTVFFALVKDLYVCSYIQVASNHPVGF